MGAIVKLKDRFVETVSGNEILIMRTDNGELLSLSGTGAAVWELIDGVRDREALIEALDARFSGPSQQIADDMGEFLRRLREDGLIDDS